MNGPNTRVTYRYLKEKGAVGHVWWNFLGKFIIDKDGNHHVVAGDDKTILEDIKRLAVEVSASNAK